MMGPLVGLRVIEIAGIGPAPLCAMLLADMGAEVIRVDREGETSPVLPIPPELDIVMRGRTRITLDLKLPAGLAALMALVERSDVLIEPFRPGVAERLGFGPEACAAVNPRLVYGRMTGWGQDGPLAQSAGHDIDYIALTGALAAIGPKESPVPPLNLVGDYGGGTMFLAFGLLAALWERERSGRGQVVDAAMVDGAAVLSSVFYAMRAAGACRNERAANLLDGGAPFYATYRCADGRFVAVGALEPRFFAELARLIGLEDRFVASQYDRATWPEMRERMATIFAGRTRDDWAAALEGSDACAAGVLDWDEAPMHPHNAARQTFLRVGEAWHPAPAPRFSRSAAHPPRAPTRPENAAAVLARIGVPEADTAVWAGAGAFG